MKALIYNPYWDSLGGGEKYTATFIKVLLDRNYIIDVFWPQNISAAITDRFGIDLTKANFTTRYASADYDLVFWVSDGSLPLSLAKRTIVHFQFPFHRVAGASLTNLLKSRFYDFVANSNFTKQIVDAEYKIKSNVIYPPIQTTSFRPAEKEKQIVYVGRFSNLAQAKGQETLVNVFKRFSTKHADWRLVLAGNTNVGANEAYLTSLQEQAKGYAIDFVFNPDIATLRSIYAKSGIFWSASGFGVNDRAQPERVEHFGMTAVEAMSAGCVPLLFSAGGHKEIIKDDNNGYLWQTEDELIHKTDQIIADKNLRLKLSKKAIESSKMFDETVFYEKMVTLIAPRT